MVKTTKVQIKQKNCLTWAIIHSIIKKILKDYEEKK